MDCPQCDQHHDGPNVVCADCLADLSQLLNAGWPEVTDTVMEWLSFRVREPQPIEEVECPKCGTEFDVPQKP